MLAGCLLGAFVAEILPHEKVSRSLGPQSGLKGLLIGTAFGAILPGGPFTAYPVASALLAVGADFGATIAMVVSWTLIGYGRAVAWELPIMGTDFTLWRIVISLPMPVLAGALGRFVYVRMYPKVRAMSAALIIDIILWGSVAAVGFIALQRGRLVLTTSLREGAMDFINIVPRIALGVIGSGYIAAVIPQEIITGWLGPDSGWLGVLTAIVAGAATPGGPVVGFSIGAVALKAGGGAPQVDRLCDRLGAVRLPAADAVGNSLHAGAVRLVPRGGVAAVPVPGGRDRDGDRQAVGAAQKASRGHPLCYNITFFHGPAPIPTATARPRPWPRPQPWPGLAASGAGGALVDPAHDRSLPARCGARGQRRAVGRRAGWR